jgi:hypothetical protein
VFGTRRFERLIVPGQPGEHTIPEIKFTYFDVEAAQYRTISTQPISVIVHPGESEDVSPPVLAAGPQKQEVARLAADIRHIKPVPSSLTSEETSLLSQPLFWSGWIFPVLVVGGVWFWQNRRQYMLLNTAYMRSQRARRVAQKTLVQAQHSEADSNGVAQRALLGYLSDKLNRPTVGLTTDNLISLISTTRLNPTLIERVEHILARIDVGRFAPGGEAEAGTLISETRKLINDLEKSFNELEYRN